MTNNTLATTWAMFYAHQVLYDAHKVEVSWEELEQTFQRSPGDTLFRGNHPDLCKEALVFGQLMSQIPEAAAGPSGTECRVPVRAFYVLNNPKRKMFKDYFSFHNGDWHAAVNWASRFSEHS